MHIIWLISIASLILIISIILQVCIQLKIPNHIWQEKRSIIAATINGLGAKFKPELREAWLAYNHKTYLDGQIEEADSMGEGLLEIDDWVPDALGLYIHWSHVVDVLIGTFSAMNTHPNTVSNLEIICIVVI